MWCAHCQADVAAEAAADNRRIHCASCGSQIESARGPSVADKTREARELLERWSSQRSLEPAGAMPSVPAESALKPKFAARIDRPHVEAFASRSEERLGDEQAVPVRAPAHLRQTAAAARIESSHGDPVPAPHFSLHPADQEPPARQGNWASAFGQLLAYSGVLGLTVGTTLILWGYFGGSAYQSYTPTGWLVATLGQMLMFLGVITIVSGGMEQTTAEVSRQVRVLGDKLLRIEQASRDHALRGPSIPAERFTEQEPAGGRPRDREFLYAVTNAK